MVDNNEIKNINVFPDPRSSGLLLNIAPFYFLLIGGGSREKVYDDVWLLNINKNIIKIQNTNGSEEQKLKVWKKLSNENFSENLFKARFGHCGIISRNDLENSFNLFIHGGQNHFTSSFYLDFFSIKFQYLENSNNFFEKVNDFVLQINTNDGIKNYDCMEYKNFIKFPVDINKSPCERNSHAIAINNITKKSIFIFGGGNGSGLLNDLWEFSLENENFIKFSIDSDKIPSREMHGMIYYKDNLYIFGGRLYDSIDNKMYKINLNSKKIECDFTTLPCALCSFSYEVYKNYLIIYGGTDGISFFNTLYIYNLKNNKWAKSKLNLCKYDREKLIEGKIGSHMSIDEESGILIIFGGSSIHQDSNETYVVSISELINENNLIQVLNN